MMKFSVAVEPSLGMLIQVIKLRFLSLPRAQRPASKSVIEPKVRDELSSLANAAQIAGSILGAAGVELLDLPDNRLDSLNRLDLIKRVEEFVEVTNQSVFMFTTLVT